MRVFTRTYFGPNFGQNIGLFGLCTHFYTEIQPNILCCNGYQVDCSCLLCIFCHYKCRLLCRKDCNFVSEMNKNKYLTFQQRKNWRVLLLMLFWLTQEVNRKCWVHPIYLLREEKGEFYQLYPDLRHFHRKFVGMYRMGVDKFEELLSKISPLITKNWTYMRKPISAEQKLVITLG